MSKSVIVALLVGALVGGGLIWFTRMEKEPRKPASPSEAWKAQIE